MWLKLSFNSVTYSNESHHAVIITTLFNIFVIVIIIIIIIVQGIRAMDDSIQTLKDEMNKLMSVYEYAKVITNTTTVILTIIHHFRISIRCLETTPWVALIINNICTITHHAMGSKMKQIQKTLKLKFKLTKEKTMQIHPFCQNPPSIKDPCSPRNRLWTWRLRLICSATFARLTGFFTHKYFYSFPPNSWNI